MSNRYFKEYSKNGIGTDYFVGDIHGCYDEFMASLNDVNFDFKKDRVFCAGDIIDRGPKNVECLQLIEEPWFFTCMGNHEEMAVNSIKTEHIDPCWAQNGGDWFTDLIGSNKIEHVIQLIKKNLYGLPYVIKVGEIALIHAEYFGDFNDLYTDLWLRRCSAQLVWARTRITKEQRFPVQNITALVHGHTPVNNMTTLGNCVHIDHSHLVLSGKTNRVQIYTYDEIIKAVSA